MTVTNPGPGRPGSDDATQAEIGAAAVAMRRDHFTYQQIADELGYSHKSHARDLVMRTLGKVVAERVDELRTWENDRLDKAARVLFSIMDDEGEETSVRIRAVDSFVRLSARRARLNGMDAPMEVAISSGMQAQLSDALSELQEAFFGDTVTGDVTGSRELDGPDDDDDD